MSPAEGGGHQAEAAQALTEDVGKVQRSLKPLTKDDDELPTAIAQASQLSEEVRDELAEAIERAKRTLDAGRPTFGGRHAR